MSQSFKKIKLIFFIFLFFGVFGLSKTTFATTHTAANCNVATIKAIIDNAETLPGDIIKVLAGSCTWTETLRITKALQIIGAGNNGDTICDSGETCITANWNATTNRETTSNYLLYINFVSTGAQASYDKSMRISGFNFNLANKVAGLMVIHNDRKYPMNKFQFDHNIMYNIKCTDWVTSEQAYPHHYMIGEIYGVAHNNSFIGSPGHQVIGGNAGWDVPGKYPGGTKALFYEDNTYLMNVNCGGTSYTRTPGITLGTGGSLVMRYNTLTRDIVGGATSGVGDWFQNHGNNDWNNTGGIVMETYGNKFIDMQSAGLMFANIRGGWNMVFFNQLITTKQATAWSGPYIDFKECEECGSTYPNNGRGADINTPTGHSCPTGDNRLYPTGENGIPGTCKGDDWWSSLRTEWWPGSHGTSASDSNCNSCSIDGIPQHVWKNYIWNNRAGSGGASDGLIRMWHLHGLSPEREIYENTHYFGQWQGATFDGSLTPVTNIHLPGQSLGKPGMGCGLISARPKKCSTGAGFWVIPDATQSCSQVLSTSVGKNPSNKIQGYLSTCKSTDIWSENTPSDIAAKDTYVPYTYPHPLRGGLPNSAPSAPTGVRVI